MQPRRHGGRARRRAAFLPAQPRHPGPRGPLHPGARLPDRGDRSSHARSRPRHAGPGGRYVVGKTGSMNVTTRPEIVPAVPPATLDIARIREDFPILRQTVRGKPLVFLDSAASAQKPRVVIDAMRDAMEHQYANVHRGLHWMSERTTEAYESCRDAVATLMNANDRSEIVFTGNITEAINLVAHSYGRGVLRPDQAVLISAMEHHSNIVPWQ